MTIEKNTEMLLFRFSKYKHYSFIDEHTTILQKNGRVWMLKLGKRSSINKLNSIVENGGWLVLHAPKSEGSKNYIARFTEMVEDKPSDSCYPNYYKEILENAEAGISIYVTEPSYQWFKIDYIQPVDDDFTSDLLISKTGKKVNDVINTTMTAVMFVKNDVPIDLPGVE